MVRGLGPAEHGPQVRGIAATELWLRRGRSGSEARAGRFRHFTVGRGPGGAAAVSGPAAVTARGAAGLARVSVRVSVSGPGRATAAGNGRQI